MAGENLCGGLSDVAYAQREQDSLERDLLRGFEAVEETLGGPLLPAVEGSQLPFVQAVEVGGPFRQPQVVQLLDRDLAGEYVHGLAAREVEQPALYLHRAAVLVGAEPFSLVLAADERGAAVGAHVGEYWSGRAFFAFREVHSGDFRNDFAAFLHEHVVSDAYVELLHHVGVVERGPSDHGPAELHRVEIRHGRDRAGASHLVVNAGEPSACLLGLELERHRPARELRGVAQGALAVQFVDLYDYAVGGVGEELPLHVPVGDVFPDFIDVMAESPLVRYRKPPALGGVQGVPV